MVYSKGFFDLDRTASGTSSFADQLSLQNVGVSVYVFRRGEGYDYLHNHREQEEIYLCIEGEAELVIAESSPAAELGRLERIALKRGEAVRVDPPTLRAIGNTQSDRALVVIAGGCPHPYPAGHGHDVIADVHKTLAHGETGFKRPDFLTHEPAGSDDC